MTYPQKNFPLKKKEPKDYKIVWEKWADPYGENIDDIEWPGWDAEKDKDLKTPEGMDEYNPELIEELEQEKRDLFKKPMRLVMTPFGVIPLTEYTTPSKIFNLWVGHTNFSITENVKKIIEEIDGVETLDIFTRYRMKVGIGKVFKPAQVTNNIDKKLKEYMKDQ